MSILKKIFRKDTPDQEFEKVEAMGTDDNKEGVKATKSILKEEEKENKEKEAIALEYLKNQRKFKDQYILTLSKLLEVKLFEDQFPKGTSYRVAPTDQGVYMELYVNGRIFQQAFKASGEPLYDLNAVDIFVMRAENTVEKVWKQNKQQPGMN